MATIIAANNGQRLLIEQNKSLGAIAKAAGVAPATPHAWKHGRSIPNDKARARLHAAFGIDPTAWDVALPADFRVTVPKKNRAGRPTKEAAAKKAAKAAAEPEIVDEDPDVEPRRREAAPVTPGGVVVPPYPARPDKDATSVENVQYQLDCIRHDLEWQPLSVTGKSKLRADETRSMAQLEKFKAAAEMSEDRYVREHPAWARFTGKLLAALEPFPDASRAVLEALKADA